MTFGDIFQYNEKDYIYLGAKGDHIHAAVVLDEKFTANLLRLHTRRTQQNSPGASVALLSSTAYCFVILKTSEMKDRACHFNNTEYEIKYFNSLNILPVKLTKEDLTNIKTEIMTKPVTEELREVVRPVII